MRESAWLAQLILNKTHRMRMTEPHYYRQPTMRAKPHPTKIRAAVKKRIRIIWFVLGIVFGGVVSQTASYFYYSTEQKRIYASNEIIPEKAALPLTKGVPEQASEAEDVEDITALPEPEWPRTIELKAKKGDTIAGILMEQGISPRISYNIVENMKKTFDPRKLREGHKMTIAIDRDDTPKRKGDPDAAKLNILIINLNKLETVEVRNVSGSLENFTIQKITKKLKTILAHSKGVVTAGSSIAAVASKQGTPSNIIANLMKAYSYDLDLQRNIKAGDSFDILYEKLVTEDGTTIKGGDIKYAMINTRRKKLPIYYYEDKNTPGQFYKKNGESVIKKLLRTPVDGARISSGFGRRKHPILGYSKMHKGIDFAASRGTKIYAAGDGIITFAGRKGGYGNYIKIKHNNTYSTAYAHCRKFAPGIKKGKKIRQGQVIAYVGSTGRSTGPHLHYEILKYGKHVNPSKVKFTGGDKLTGSRYRRFKTFKANISKQLKTVKAPS